MVPARLSNPFMSSRRRYLKLRSLLLAVAFAAAACPALFEPEAEAAEPTASACGRPELVVNIGDTYWNSYVSYMLRNLSVELSVTNTGGTGAVDLVIVDTTDTSGVTSTVSGDNEAVGDIASAASASVTLTYQVPFGVQGFRSTIHAAVQDSCGNLYEFPVSDPDQAQELTYTVVDTGQTDCYGDTQQSACPAPRPGAPSTARTPSMKGMLPASRIMVTAPSPTTIPA